jgi:hypothetical protein
MTMTRTKQGKLTDYRPFQLALIGLGWLLVVLAPIVSPLPGPGGLLLFVLGFPNIAIGPTGLCGENAFASARPFHP